MLRFVSVFAFVAIAQASYGGGGGGGDDYGGKGGYGGGGDYHKSVDAPVNSYHSVQTYPAQSNIQQAKTPVVNINSGPIPLKINFNSHSSQIHASQNHFGAPGRFQKSYHVDEPDVLVQNVKKPIIQEVHEVITPYRHRTQKLMPVQEKVETIIPQTHGGYGGGGMGGGYGGGHGGGMGGGYGGGHGGGGGKY